MREITLECVFYILLLVTHNFDVSTTSNLNPTYFYASLFSRSNYASVGISTYSHPKSQYNHCCLCSELIREITLTPNPYTSIQYVRKHERLVKDANARNGTKINKPSLPSRMKWQWGGILNQVYPRP